jgi:flagellar basal-body rod protein FlgF
MEISGTIALSRMMALQQKMDIVGNNIANMNTTGFKAVQLLMKSEKENNSAPGIQPLDSRPIIMATDFGTVRDTSTGAVKTTGNPLDVAIQGSGYFTVATPNGDRYTRDGVFQISSTGQLVDLSGNAVQGDGGEINIPAGTTNVSIAGDGTISTPNRTLGKLKLVNFANEQALQPDGNNGLKAADGNAPTPLDNPKMVQGAVEQSNVNSVQQMTNMIEIQRQYQAAANIVKDAHDRQNRAIQELAKTNS